MLSNRLYNQSVSTMQEQMFIISDCLLSLGYRELSKLAQKSGNWEFVHEFVNLIKVESYNRKDDTILDNLSRAWLVKDLI